MNISDTRSSCIVKIDLRDMDAEMRSAKVQSLLSSGFEIKSSIPVSDEGKPYLLLILEQKSDTILHKKDFLLLLMIFIIVVTQVYEILH